MKINRFRGEIVEGRRWINRKENADCTDPFSLFSLVLDARGKGSIPLCLSLNEIGIYGGAALDSAHGRRRDVKIRRKQIFEGKGASEARAKIRRDKD